MKNFLKSTKFKISLLCVGLLIVGIGIGLLINAKKTIPTLSDGKQVVASIDGKDFTAEDLYAKLKEQGGETVLSNLIDEYIANKEIDDTTEAKEYAESYVANLKSQYDSYGYDFKEALAEAGYDSEEAFTEIVYLDQLKQTVADNFIKNTENGYISEKEVKDYWKKNIEGAMTVKYILITPEEVDESDKEYATKKEENENKALKTANEVIKKLKDGEDFSELAKKYSDDKTTAPEGGLLSGFNKEDVVEEFWKAATGLKDGKYTTTPVKSSYGYFVILRVSQEDKPSLEDSKNTCLDALLAEKKEKDSDITTKAWIKIRKSYNLDIVDSDIKKAYDKTVKKAKKESKDEK